MKKEKEPWYVNAELQAEIIGKLDFISKIEELTEPLERNTYNNAHNGKYLRIANMEKKYILELRGHFFLKYSIREIFEIIKDRTYHITRADYSFTFNADIEEMIMPFFNKRENNFKCISIKEKKKSPKAVLYFNSNSGRVQSLSLYNTRYTFAIYNKTEQVIEQKNKDYEQDFITKHKTLNFEQDIVRVEVRIKNNEDLKEIKSYEEIEIKVKELIKKIYKKLKITEKIPLKHIKQIEPK